MDDKNGSPLWSPRDRSPRATPCHAGPRPTRRGSRLLRSADHSLERGCVMAHVSNPKNYCDPRRSERHEVRRRPRLSSAVRTDVQVTGWYPEAASPSTASCAAGRVDRRPTGRTDAGGTFTMTGGTSHCFGCSALSVTVLCFARPWRWSRSEPVHRPSARMVVGRSHGSPGAAQCRTRASASSRQRSTPGLFALPRRFRRRADGRAVRQLADRSGLVTGKGGCQLWRGGRHPRASCTVVGCAGGAFVVEPLIDPVQALGEQQFPGAGHCDIPEHRVGAGYAGAPRGAGSRRRCALGPILGPWPCGQLRRPTLPRPRQRCGRSRRQPRPGHSCR